MVRFRVCATQPDGIRANNKKNNHGGRGAFFRVLRILGSRGTFCLNEKGILIACRGDFGVCFGAAAGRVFMRKNMFGARAAFES